MSHYQKHLFICVNQKDPGKKCCANAGGLEYVKYLKERLQSLDMHGPNKIRVSQSGCLGRCNEGPCIVVYPEGIWYTYANFQDMDEIIEQHLIKGQIVARLRMPS